jgi:hypothetical protein
LALVDPAEHGLSSPRFRTVLTGLALAGNSPFVISAKGCRKLAKITTGNNFGAARRRASRFLLFRSFLLQIRRIHGRNRYTAWTGKRKCCSSFVVFRGDMRPTWLDALRAMSWRVAG